ncbi:DUF262 domain-containing HNH endonuclease family protein [Alteromonas ponticola]|uniref:DUF262 domain-containing HNH endonuclease family protein n=1 Tax=Alteromonas aquimaris TaxID=2998417 RepID=A0ABT3P2X6_9ALTE|nr:DUF262 domain-containing HNH endonuclease family protein [Alteromonas aquimaris]MCW8107121.1 DUF262 domain-containing HNH endonuclease family protein [Alteromonas aquimaris]
MASRGSIQKIDISEFIKYQGLSMQVTPEYKSFGELFSEKNIFITPKYQRDYSWEAEQVEQFSDDIKNTLEKFKENQEFQHFFGGIVCAQEQRVGNSIVKNVLIDGQQRLSTIVLFFSAIKETLQNLECNEQDSDFRDALLKDVEKYLTFEERVHRNEKEVHPRISIGKADDYFFQAATKGTELDINRDSHKLILEARKHFIVFIDSCLLRNKGVLESLEVIDDVIKLFENNFLLIQIIATTVDDAYKLFMVLNDRGINLTEAELLKAHTIGNFDENCSSVRMMSDDWDYILANESKNVSDYLRWIITMITGEHVTNTQILDKYKTDYLNEDLTAKEMAKRVKFIRKSTEKLKLLTEAEWPFEQSPQTTQYHKTKLDWLVKKLKHTHAMPLILAASFGKETEFQKTISETCKFFIRYKVISNMHASLFSKLYPPIAKEALEKKDRFSISLLQKRFKKEILSRDEDNANFSAGIGALNYKRKGDNRPIKYLLVTLQENWMWATSTPPKPIKKMLAMEDKSIVFDFNNTTIEHIYPYSARKDDVIEEMESVKNQIGNLALLDINRNRSNADKPFREKKDKFDNTGIGIHSKIVEKEQWSKGEFEELKSRYIELMIKVFSF